MSADGNGCKQMGLRSAEGSRNKAASVRVAAGLPEEVFRAAF